MNKGIQLHVKGGGLVVTLDPDQDPAIYNMNPKPDVIFWGERVFLIDPKTRWPSGIAVRYEEICVIHAFTMSVVTPTPLVDRSARVLTDGSPETPDHREIDPATGMQKAYVVLSAEERAKGFARHVRRSYVHQKCGNTTTMNHAIAETYARDPKFYDGTFCATCKEHFPIGENGEFVWEDGSKVGS